MTRIPIPWRIAACTIASLVTAGCVSIDGRAASETPDRAATINIAGAWQARAFYRTKGELLGPASIAEALQLPARGADTVEIASTPDGGLAFTFEARGELLLKRTYPFSEGVRIDERGAYVLPVAGTCSGGDLQAGCWTWSTTLFVNAHRELVFVTEDNAAGIVTILPVMFHSKHVSVFVRNTGDPDVDNVPLIR
jgi:hypothetical protein